MDNLCRICRTSDSIEELCEFFHDPKLCADFYFVTGIPIISIDPTNPSLICSTCIDSIKIFTKFKKKAQKSDEYFRCKTIDYEKIYWNSQKSDNFEPKSIVKQEQELSNNVTYWADIENIKAVNYNVEFVDENPESNNQEEQWWNNAENEETFEDYAMFLDESSRESEDRNDKDFSLSNNVKPKIENRSPEVIKSTRNVNSDSPNPKKSIRRRSDPCKICGKRVSSNRTLKLHMAVVHNLLDKVYVCKHCGKIFKHDSYLRKHVQSSHNMVFLKSRDAEIKSIKQKKQSDPDSKPQIDPDILNSVNSRDCKICGREFSSIRTCKTHLKVAHGADSSVFVCKICDSKFKLKEYIHRHMRSRHNCVLTDDNHFIEDEPEENYDEIDLDVVELAKPTSRVVTNYCKICDLTLSSRRSYSEHIKIKHNSDDKIYYCNFCPKTFIVLSYLKKHMHKAHAHSLKQAEIIVKRKKEKIKSIMRNIKEENVVENRLNGEDVFVVNVF